MMPRKEAWPSELSCRGSAIGLAELSACRRAHPAAPMARFHNRKIATSGSTNAGPVEIHDRFTGFLSVPDRKLDPMSGSRTCLSFEGGTRRDSWLQANSAVIRLPLPID